MLALTRRAGERLVVVANDIEVWITAVQCHDGRVRLGIEAPSEVAVHREEVYRALVAEGRIRVEPGH